MIRELMVAKKKQNPRTALAVYLIGALGAILILMSFIAIISLFFVWLYLEWKIKAYAGIRGRGDFKLSPPELNELHAASAARSRITPRIEEINRLRKTLPLRADGQFDNRNREGKQLNLELQTLRADLEECDQLIEALSNHETTQFRRWATIKSGQLSSRASLLTLPVVALFLHSIRPPTVATVSTLIERQTGLDSVAGIEMFYGTLVVTAGISTTLFLLAWGTLRLLILNANKS